MEEKKAAGRNPALVFGVWLASVAAIVFAFRVGPLADGKVPDAGGFMSMVLLIGGAWMITGVCNWIVEGTWKAGKPTTAKTVRFLALLVTTIAVAYALSQVLPR